jgi:hypothetical protein
MSSLMLVQPKELKINKAAKLKSTFVLLRSGDVMCWTGCVLLLD